MPETVNVHDFKVVPSTESISSPSIVPSTTDYSATGLLEDGAELTVSTSVLDFGVGPTILIYDDFARGTIDVNATIGLWNETVNPLLSPHSRGASKALTVSKDAHTGKMGLTFDTPASDELFQSQTIICPKGKNWTGETGWPYATQYPGTIPNDSTHKFNWFFSVWDDGGTANSNIIMPSHVNGVRLSSGGNSHTLKSSVGDLVAPFLNWFTFDSWVKVGSTPSAADGVGSFTQTGIDTGRYHHAWADGQMFGGSNNMTSYVGYYVTGWAGDGTQVGQEIAFTEIYTATSPKRFIVTNSAVLAESNQSAICPHTAWASSQVKLHFKMAALNPLTDPIYLHYLDENNTNPSALGLLLNPAVMT
jgi:hypothetical protein